MNHTQREEIEIDLKELFYILKEKFLLILAVGLLVSCLSCAVTVFLMPPVYTSTSSILVLTKETTLASLADLQMGSQLTNDYEVLITSRPVLERVIKNLNLDMEYQDLREDIAINNPTDTRILEVAVESPSPRSARRIVNELTQIASEFIGEKMEVVPPKIIEEGELPIEKTSPILWINALIGLLIGLICCAGLLAVMAVLDDTIKTEDDVEKYLGIPTLAVVPDRKDYIGNQKKKGFRKGKKKGKKKKEQGGKKG